MPDPLAVRCRACLAAPGEACIGTTSDLPRERVHRLRPLAGTARLVRCESCEGSGWQPTGRTVAGVAITCPVCDAAPHTMCTEGGTERSHLHVVRRRAAKAGLVSCEACDAVGWLPEPPEPEGSAPLRLPVRLGPSPLGTIIDSTGAFIARAAGRELGKAMVVALNAAPSDHAPGRRPVMSDRPQDTPTDGVHVIPGEVPEGVVPPSASMAVSAGERTPDVPDDLLDLAMRAWFDNGPGKPGNWSAEQQVRAILAAVLPEHTRQVREQTAAAYQELLASIWLYVNWSYVTRQLTTEQKELWADAVDADSDPEVQVKANRWWRS